LSYSSLQCLDTYNDDDDDDNINNSNNNNMIGDNEKRTCMLIDVAIPGDRNVIKKEA
jgi:hypothetical protein